MRTKFSSNRELAHIWANNDDPTVYKTANSVSCQFNRFFSYNTCIAEIVGDSVIFNIHSYSNTTAKHQSLLYSAMHGKNIIALDIPPLNLKTLVFTQNDFNQVIVEHSHRKIAELLVKSYKARLNSEHYKASAYKIGENLKAYANLLGLDYSPLDLSEYQNSALEADKVRKAQEKIRKAEKIKEQAESLEKWRAGADIRAYFETTALRIKGDEIETSKGAKVPVEHAIRAFPLLVRLHKGENSIDLSAHSIKLGHYTVNRVEKDRLIVGCHSIPFNEIYSIANQLNLGV